jgi:hypothetical protein
MFHGLYIIPESLDIVLYDSSISDTDSRGLLCIGNLYKFFTSIGVRKPPGQITEFILNYKVGNMDFLQWMDEMRVPSEISYSPSVVLSYALNSSKEGRSVDVSSAEEQELAEMLNKHFAHAWCNFLNYTCNIGNAILLCLQAVTDTYSMITSGHTIKSMMEQGISLKDINMVREGLEKFPMTHAYACNRFGDNMDYVERIASNIESALEEKYKEFRAEEEERNKINGSYKYTSMEELDTDSYFRQQMTSSPALSLRLDSSNSPLLYSIDKYDTMKNITEATNHDEAIMTSMLDIMLADKQLKSDLDVQIMTAYSDRYDYSYRDKKSERPLGKLVKYLLTKMTKKYKGLVDEGRLKINSKLAHAEWNTPEKGRSWSTVSGQEDSFFVANSPIRRAEHETSDGEAFSSDFYHYNYPQYIKDIQDAKTDAEKYEALGSLRRSYFMTAGTLLSKSGIAEKLFKTVLTKFK